MQEPAMDPCGREWVEEDEFSALEFVAVTGLLELSHTGRDMWEFPPWGSKKKRSRQIAGREDSNCDDEVKKPKEEEEEAKEVVRPKRLRMKIRLAGAEENETRKNRETDDGKKKDWSPTTPLSWNGTERGSGSTSGAGAGSGDKSDTATQTELCLPGPAAPPAAPPCDRPQGQWPALKVEIGDKVHNPSNRRGTKKKTIAELKEQVNELSLEQEELKKEKVRRSELLKKLRVAYEISKAQEAVCCEKGETKPPAAPSEISSDLAEETKRSALLKSSLGHVELECSENLDVNSLSVQVMDGTSSIANEVMDGTSSIANILPPHHINMNNSGTEDLVVATNSPADRFLVPDLNIPVEPDSIIPLQLEDSSDNNSGGFHEQVPQLNRAVVAAEARKHRKDCLRGKVSQFGKSRFR